MFGFKFISKISAVLFCLSVSSLAVADPFTVTFSDTLSDGSESPPFNAGEAITISIVLDNGGVRRQSIWHRLSLFLRDTFLPVLSPV